MKHNSQKGGEVVLVSGGVDSAVVARLAKNPVALFIDYGQPSCNQERESATVLCHTYRIPLYVSTLNGLQLMEMDDRPGKPGPRIIPNRNSVMISIAGNLAASLGKDEVHIGCLDDDFEYKDCRRKYIAALDELTFDVCGVHVVAPIIAMNKRAVIAQAASLNLDITKLWSCYTHIDGRPCGTCDSCEARNKALAGVLK